MELPEVATAARLSLRPGDRLVLTFARPLTDAGYHSVLSQVKTWNLPEDVKVIVLDSGADLKVLAREDS
jgi:hypothetical protein